MRNSINSTITHGEVPLFRPWVTEDEITAAAEVLRSGWLTQGPRAEEFEREFARRIGARHAICVSSGSAALLVAMAALEVSPGDEVLVPDMTFVSTATAALFLGARPVFADIDLAGYAIAAEDIERRITNRTRLIVPVHYAGQTADMDSLREVARAHGLPILEDAAQAHLAEYRGEKAGTIGDMGIFSFTPSKLMTTGEGGVITTSNDDLAERARLFRNFGDTGKFHWDVLGFNFRMADMMAAVGLQQLKKLDEAVAKRRRIAAVYTRAFRDLEVIICPRVRAERDHNFQLYTIRLRFEMLSITRDRFIAELARRGVSSRLYYPCLHLQGVFAGLGPFSDRDYPRAVEFSCTAVSLPIFSEITDQQIAQVIHGVMDVITAHRR